MKTNTQILAAAITALFALTTTADAHVMMAQRGTVNFERDGAFVMLSLPVSAFWGVDDDRDGRLSAEELRKNYPRITDQITRGVVLRDDIGPRKLEGLVVNLSRDHHSNQRFAKQVVAMGRFQAPRSNAPARLRVDLFGRAAHEQLIEIRARRGRTITSLRFTPMQPTHAVPPSSPATPHTATLDASTATCRISPATPRSPAP